MLSCPCGREFRTLKVGVRVLQELDNGSPYKLFSADLLECPGCRHQILRWAARPIAEHFEPEFGKVMAQSPVVTYEARR